MRSACIPAQTLFSGRSRSAAEASMVERQHGQPRAGAQGAVACIAAGHQHGHTATCLPGREAPRAQLQAITGLQGHVPPARHQLGGTPCP
jgi:hypothetical protein